jgi:cystathionine beta-lyase/cystathionine gamma-synthase
MAGDSLDFETRVAHAGIGVRTGEETSTAPPIVPSTTFTYDSIDAVHAALTPEGQGYAYARNANPTVVLLERTLADLEGAEDAVAFGSGLAAIETSIIGLGLQAGDTVLAGRDLYGGSRGILMQLSRLGLRVEFADVCDVDEVERALERSRPSLLHLESVSNPLLRVPDIARLVDLAHRRNVTVMLDNTFATPYLYRPLDDGVDLVVHSASKYLAGHGDVMAGIVAGTRRVVSGIRDARTVSGGVLSPFEAWLTLRGMRTLAVRMERHCRNALEVASWLERQAWVDRVYYPGLVTHAQHETARRQFGRQFGGMASVDLAAGRPEILRFLDALRVIVPGTSLGDVESLVLYPPLASHRQLDDEGLRAAGIGQGLLRISIGLESPRDLMADLEQAARTAGIAQGAATTAGGRAPGL